MALTDAQLPTLKTAIDAETDPDFVVMRNAGATQEMADWFNADSTSTVWRTRLTESEIVSDTSPDATVWNWTDYINTSVAEKMAWERMFNGDFSINPSLAQVRSGIGDIFSGPQGANQRTHLLAMGKRLATKAEWLYATGTGTTGDPGTMDFEGNLTNTDVAKALQLP
jgi:hypothetical protein